MRFEGEKGILKSIILSVFILLIIGTAVFLDILFFANWQSEQREEARKPNPFAGLEIDVGEKEPFPVALPEAVDPSNLLIICIDSEMISDDHQSETDFAIFFGRIDEANRRAALLSIPSNTLIETGGEQLKAESVRAELGVEKAMLAIGELIGLEISNYIFVHESDILGIVDLYGGVPVTVTEPLGDPEAEGIPEGFQNLDGAQSVLFLKNADYPDGDLKRVLNQQIFVRGFLAKWHEWSSVPSSTWFLSAIFPEIETDMSLRNLIRLQQIFSAADSLDLSAGTLPGSMSDLPDDTFYYPDLSNVSITRNSLVESCFIPQF